MTPEQNIVTPVIVIGNHSLIGYLRLIMLYHMASDLQLIYLQLHSLTRQGSKQLGSLKMVAPTKRDVCVVGSLGLWGNK